MSQVPLDRQVSTHVLRISVSPVSLSLVVRSFLLRSEPLSKTREAQLRKQSTHCDTGEDLYFDDGLCSYSTMPAANEADLVHLKNLSAIPDAMLMLANSKPHDLPLH